MEIVPGLHWVEGIRDTKVYLWIEGERVTVIDAAMPGRAGVVFRHLASLGRRPEAVTEIWLTHGHIDHMGSVDAIKQGSGARVVAHEADVPVVEGRANTKAGLSASPGTMERLVHWALDHAVRYRPAGVDCAVRDGDWLGSWQVVHVPGHTPGSVCYHNPGHRIVLVGDAINHRRGRLGVPPRLFSSDMAQAYASIGRIAALGFEICCFGHGPALRQDAQGRVQELAESCARHPEESRRRAARA
jgi:glyoxylase-like metal-dependent hydrolase (beta-lactamase superfamily II)